MTGYGFAEVDRDGCGFAEIVAGAGLAVAVAVLAVPVIVLTSFVFLAGLE